MRRELTRIARAAGLLAGVTIVAACGGTQREAVSTTSTTSAEPAYTPGAVELYLGRQNANAGACTSSLSPSVQFAPTTDGVLPGENERLATWATCLQRPELAHTTVVLVGGDEPGGAQGLFAARAAKIRNALVERGVDPARILVGAPSRAREGGRTGATSAVNIELTSSQSLRALTPPVHPPVTGGVGYGVR